MAQSVSQMPRSPRTFRCTINHPPRAKQGVRFGPKGTYQNPKILAYEKLVREAWLETGHPMLTTPVKVRVKLHPDRSEVWVTEILGEEQEKGTGMPTGDVDNYFKALGDGLEGAAFGNDRQVRHLTVSKHGRLSRDKRKEAAST